MIIIILSRMLLVLKYMVAWCAYGVFDYSFYGDYLNNECSRLNLVQLLLDIPLYCSFSSGGS